LQVFCSYPTEAFILRNKSGILVRLATNGLAEHMCSPVAGRVGELAVGIAGKQHGEFASVCRLYKRVFTEEIQDLQKSLFTVKKLPCSRL
jgi:hypothetical protein